MIKNSKGFTIIELLIATSVFSLIMLVVSTGIIRMGQAYYKGIIQSRTQETTRSVAEDISRSIQLANDDVVPLADKNVYCVGNIRYTYYIDQKVVSSGSPSDKKPGLTSERLTGGNQCSSTTEGEDKKELLAENTRLLRFKLGCDSTNICTIQIRTAYGDNDLLSHYDNNGRPLFSDPGPGEPARSLALNGNDTVSNGLCKSGAAGGSFCATSRLDFSVKRRLTLN